MFVKQKGADEIMIKELDDGLKNYANIIESNFNLKINDVKGVGAAGGVGATLITLLNGKLKSGIGIIIDCLKLEEEIKDADLVITGEGSIDYQTKHGKTPYGVAKVANKFGVLVIAICGSLGKNYKELYNEGFNSIFSIIDSPMELNECINKTPILLQNITESICRLYILNKG